MKNKTLIIVLTTLILSGCGEDFLDLNPVSQANVGNFYKTEDDISNAVWGVYDILQQREMYGFTMLVATENRSDNATVALQANEYADFDNFNIGNDNSIINDLWNTHYSGIYRANVILARIGDVSMNEVLRDQYIGEVKFLRGLMYFNLVRLFGDIPLVLTEPSSIDEGYGHVRRPAAEIYQQIEQDLIDASQLLPDSYTGIDIGKATSGAALGLLGKVHLTNRDFAAASNVLLQVISGGDYDLLPNYADIFDPANSNHIESMFEVQYKAGSSGEGSRYPNDAAPYQSGSAVVSVGDARGIYVPEANLINEFEVGDLRKDVTVAESYIDGGGNTINVAYPTKLISQPFQSNDSDLNWFVLRYADVLLMYAESLNEQGYVADGDAFDYLNMIRDRAGLTNLTSADLTNQSEFRTAVESERRLELAFEGHRWFDLVRTGRYVPVMNSRGYIFTVEDYHRVYPIPQSQIDINPSVLTQNTGYFN